MNDNKPPSLPHYMGSDNAPDAVYPRYVVQMFAGELHLCIETKRLLGIWRPRSVKVRMIGGHYKWVQPPGPAKPHYTYDLLPVDDLRPHWITTKPRSKRR